MKPVRKFIMAALFFFASLSHTQALEPEEAQEAPNEQEQEIPTLDFLEFLGEWETEDGEWIAPEDLENMPLSENENDETKNE